MVVQVTQHALAVENGFNSLYWVSHLLLSIFNTQETGTTSVLKTNADLSHHTKH